MADIDDLLGPSGSSQPELRSYEFPWYQRAVHNFASVTGLDKSPAGMQWARKLVGTDNPVNNLGNANEGYDKAAQGYRNGDPREMLAGAVQMGLAALPIAGPAASAVGRSLGRLRAPVPRGPWNMTAAEFENAVPSRVQPEGPPPPVDRYKDKPAQWRIDDASRRQDMLEDEAKAFLDKRYPGRVIQGDHRATYDIDEALAKFAASNENVPHLARRADEYVERMGVANKEWSDAIAARRKEYDAWDKALGEFAGPAGHERYFKDAMRHDVPTLLTGDPSVNPYELTSILRQNYGANPTVPGSIEKAYNRFWADELAAKRAGQPTMHDIAFERYGKIDPEAEMADMSGKLNKLDPNIEAARSGENVYVPFYKSDLAKTIGTGVAGGAAGMGAAEAIRRGLDSQALEDLLSRYNPRGPR